jgi:phosphoribosylformylglycinamidine cyclo-ligase
LARRALLEQAGLSLDEVPGELGRSVGEELLEPTAIYVRAVLELLRSDVAVHGLAHITGDGLLNLLRLNDAAGYEIDDPLEPQPVFGLIDGAGSLGAAEMYRAFNMGTGFCCVVAAEHAQGALALLRRHHPGSKRIGTVTGEAGRVRLPAIGIAGGEQGFAPL